MELKAVRDDQQSCWLVTGDGISARVHGTIKWGPNGAIDGKGAMKHRKAILEAVENFRSQGSSCEGDIAK